MMIRAILKPLALASLLLMAACEDTPDSSVTFAPEEDATLKDPDNPTIKFRVDMAKVEQEFPLSRKARMTLTPEIVAGMSQEQVDQVYGRLTAGPIPDGIYSGNLFFARGDSVRPLRTDLRIRIEEVLGGLKGRLAGRKIELLESIGRRLWKGKMFFRDERILRNMIEDIEPLRVIVEDADGLMTRTIPRKGLLGYIWPETSVWLLFPAKLYCGQSLLDGRRESVIIDYLFSDDIAGYRASPDSLAGRGGLKIRDEIRMVRPGFYLGRAYANKVFLLNFTLYNADVADAGSDGFAAGGRIDEDCWPGEQIRSAAAQ